MRIVKPVIAVPAGPPPPSPATERPAPDLPQRLARCVATMVYYHKDGWSWSGAKLLDEEAADLSRWAEQAGVEDGLSDLILPPLEQEMTERFGTKLGPRLAAEFRKALRRSSDPGDD